MTIDEGLTEIFRAAMSEVPGVAEKKMMGGICFLVNGMFPVSTYGPDLML